ncbi:MAG: hypothetical protein ACYDCQ_05790 [Dehalococcoidia bacterium]
MMTSDYVEIDITNEPELARVADAVDRTRRPHVLKRGDETIAVVRPAPKRGRASRRRAKPFTMNDPLWEIMGIADDAGPSDVSANKDRYLAEAYATKSR